MAARRGVGLPPPVGPFERSQLWTRPTWRANEILPGAFPVEKVTPAEIVERRDAMASARKRKLHADRQRRNSGMAYDEKTRSWRQRPGQRPPGVRVYRPD